MKRTTKRRREGRVSHCPLPIIIESISSIEKLPEAVPPGAATNALYITHAIPTPRVSGR